jgi:membrane dipeptidase
VVYRRAEEQPVRRHWLPALRSGSVAVQVCPLHVWWDNIGDRGLRSGLEQIRELLRTECENSEVVLVRNAADLDTAKQPDRIGLMISIEGAEVPGNDPAMVDVFHKLGVRMIGLTHLQRNAFADGNGERSDGDLSALGRELVARVEDHGIMLDLAHASDRTFTDVLDQATMATVLVSHAGCRTLCNNPRNVTDDQLRMPRARAFPALDRVRVRQRDRRDRWPVRA